MDPIVAALATLCALVVAWHAQDLRAALRAPRLAPEPALPADGPLISVIIPARDEAARIGACLASLAAQRYRRFEVLVLDDGSSDGTADLARGFAARLPGLRVLDGRPLPAGWGGKSWACWQAAQAARGELLLFLDADVAPRPELLAALAARAAARDMVTLVPLIALGSPAERLVLPAFAALLAAIFPFEHVNDPSSPAAFAIGQCIMLRRAAYERIGGHQAVRASVIEDMELARRAKAAGLRLEVRAAPELIGVRMYGGWRDLAEGLTKNAAAGLGSGGRRAGWAGLRLGLMAALPFDLLLAGVWLSLTAPESAAGVWLALAGATLLALGTLCWGLAMRWRHGASVLWGALMPLGLAVYFGLAAAALLRRRGGRGVTWKGRMFPG